MTDQADTKKLFSVYCRFRPLNERERNEENGAALTLVRASCTSTEAVMRQHNERGDLSFEFDGIHYEDCSQNDFYRSISGHVEYFVAHDEDLNILTYGQTSSGKTWTVDGSFNKDARGGSGAEQHGIMPRIIRRMYDAHAHDSIHISYYEIYCDKVYDLFRDEQREAKFLECNGQIKIDLTKNVFTSATEALRKLHSRNAKRHFAETEMNKSSSRSHTFLEIHVVRKTLRIIDLAGSERVSKTNVTNQTLVEGININSSLMYLKQMIELLSNKNVRRSRTFPKFRESKLTRILHYSITTGRATVILILCCSPSAFNLNETLNTLRFGSTARTVERPEVRVDNAARAETELRETVRRSKAELEKLTERMHEMRRHEIELMNELDRLRKHDSTRMHESQDTERRSYEDQITESSKRVERLHKTVQKQNADIEQTHETLRSCKKTIELQRHIINTINEEKQRMEQEITFYRSFALYVQDWTREEDENTGEEYIQEFLRSQALHVQVE